MAIFDQREVVKLEPFYNVSDSVVTLVQWRVRKMC